MYCAGQWTNVLDLWERKYPVIDHHFVIRFHFVIRLESDLGMKSKTNWSRTLFHAKKIIEGR